MVKEDFWDFKNMTKDFININKTTGRENAKFLQIRMYFGPQRPLKRLATSTLPVRASPGWAGRTPAVRRRNTSPSVIYGYLSNKAKVHRKGKYWIGEDEFSGKTFPQFCNGYFVVATRDVIDDIYEVSKTIRFFRLEDVFIYGTGRQVMLDVQLIHLDVVTHFVLKYQDCVKDHKYRCKYIAVHMPPDMIMKYYNLTMEQRRMLAHTGGPHNSSD
ncbi:hypothetical protein RRG08_005429 [Elysia crispata]|uniref:Hexosyltransferase n=1 Tax=Elysia crispata TaxID=231223 RepID=A0AAE1CQK4_9GAST|nr:hypothetical protein RRG08_005429 [Elysia crispata]